MRKITVFYVIILILSIFMLCSCKRDIDVIQTETVTAGTEAETVQEKEDVSLTLFSYEHVGIPDEDKYVYRAELNNDNAVISIEIEGIDSAYTHETDKAFFDRLAKMIEKYNLKEWNGFHKIDSTVNTIDEFTLQINYSDDSSISASGSCTYPKNYENVLSEIDNIFGPYRQSLIDQASKEENADNPQISVKLDYNSYFSEKRARVIAKTISSVISMSDSSASKYPELKEAFDTLNEENSERFEREFDSIKAAALVDLEENDMMYGYYTEEEIMHVHRADSNIVSLLCDDYIFIGGAHPSSYVKTLNFDSKTGKQLSLDDISYDTEKLLRLVPIILKNKYPIETFYVDLDEYFDSAILDTSILTWSINNDSITFYFNQYDIAPYASGLLTASIPFDGNDDLLKLDKLTAGSEYISELSDFCVFETDLDGNGDADSVEIFFESEFTDDNEFMDYGKITITINDNMSEHEFYGFTHNCYYVHKDADKSFLYVTTRIENDYDMIYAYKLTPNNAEYLGNTYGSIAWFSDPESIDIYEPTFLLGTIFGYKNYHIGDSGLLETDDADYTLSAGTALDVMLPFKGIELNEDGISLNKTIQVEAGDTALPVRTDDIKYVDLKTDTGYVRVEIDTSDWPHTINGVDIEEIFKGIIFAG